MTTSDEEYSMVAIQVTRDFGAGNVLVAVVRSIIAVLTLWVTGFLVRDLSQV